MGDYNPKTSYQFRWSDSKKIQKFIQGQVVVKDVNLVPTDPTVYNFNTVPEAKELADTAKYCLENNVPMIIYDDVNQYIWFSYVLTDGEAHFFNANYNLINTLFLDIYDDHIEVNYSSEEMLSADNVKTLFGDQSIIGTGNIDLYRHQLTLTNTNNVSVMYIVISSKNLPINSGQDFVTVTKADKDYTGQALYLDASSNVQPAFIRYSAGNVIIQLQNGSIAPVKTITDIVTTI